MFETVMNVLVALGGGTVIIGAFTYWLGNLWTKRLIQNEKTKLDQFIQHEKMKLDLEIESHKVRLKKSEFIFEKQYAAASELTAIIRSILPPLLHPDMDWGDACDEIAYNFDNIIRLLEDYLCKHGAILKDEIKESFSRSIGIASQSKFEVIDGEVSSSANKSANDIFNLLLEAEKKITEQVHDQVKI